MQQLQNWLKDYGLNSTAITVYLCVLKHPAVKAADIQRLTGIVRTTIYYAVAELKSKGLLSENLQNNVKTYRAADITNLQNSIELAIGEEKRKLETLINLKPVFDRLTKPEVKKETLVKRYEGLQSVKQAIEEAFRCDSRRWHVIASRDNFLSHTSKHYQRYYLKERKRRGIISKTLWEPVDEQHNLSLEDVFYRNPRRLPKEFLGAFTSLVIMYDDTTLIIDPYEQKTAHAIQDPTGTQLFRLMFETVWSNAQQN